MAREDEIKNYAYNNCINDDVDDTSYSLIIERPVVVLPQPDSPTKPKTSPL